MNNENKYYDLKEVIEENDVPLFNILNKRINKNEKIKIGKYSTGPPDILYFVREPNKKINKKKFKNKKFGSYFYIYGMDTSNLFSVEKYINDYITIQKKFFRNNKNDLINEILKYSVITKAVFCSYDFFIEKDFRIIFNYPEGFDRFYFYDGINNDYEITEDDLRTIFLSSVLRSWSYITNIYNNYSNKNSIFLEEIKNNENFNALIDSIIFILIERLEYKYPNLDKKLSILFFWFSKYLMYTRRYSFILTYFSKLSHIDTNLAVFALKPLFYLDGYKDGLKFIAKLLTCNTNHSLICEEINFLIFLIKFEEALKLGKYLTTINPGFNKAWLKLAEVYLKLKKYDKCLKALNNLNYLKNFLDIDNINYDNPYRINNEYNKIIIKENIITNNLNSLFLLNYDELISFFKYNIDISFNASNLLLGENDDLIKDIINKVTNGNFLKFNDEQKKMYYILLQIMKEINFTKFIELKNNLFSFLKNANDTCNKILINPFLEIVVDTLIEDIKLFSLGCFIKEKNENKKNKNTNTNDLSQI